MHATLWTLILPSRKTISPLIAFSLSRGARTRIERCASPLEPRAHPPPNTPRTSSPCLQRFPPASRPAPRLRTRRRTYRRASIGPHRSSESPRARRGAREPRGERSRRPVPTAARSFWLVVVIAPFVIVFHDARFPSRPCGLERIARGEVVNAPPRARCVVSRRSDDAAALQFLQKSPFGWT